mgnify:CR=1 FL=1
MKINETVARLIFLFYVVVVFILTYLLLRELTAYVEWIAQAWTFGGRRGRKGQGFTISMVFGLAVLVLTGYIYSYFWGKLKLIRSFKAIAQSSISKCSDGEIVRIQGTLELMPTKLTAPFSQRQCSAYSISALKPLKRPGITSTYWETIAFKLLANDFLIRCKKHFVLVQSNHAKIIIQTDTVHDESSYSKELGGFLTYEENAKRKRTFEALGVSPIPYIGAYGKDVKFEEGVLMRGERVAVLGRGQWISTAEYQELRFLSKRGIDKVFEIATDAEQQLVISDSADFLE